MRKLENAKRNAFFAALSAAYALYVPVDTNGGAEYQKWHSGTKLSAALHTNRSAKDFFFPQTENLMDFKVTGKQIEIIDTRKEGEDFILFGVRGCDARSFDILDRVFLADPVDSYYQNRRAHGIIFSMACTRPAETCFCGTFGIDAANPQGDVVCYETEDALYLDARSPKGEKALAVVSDLLADGDEEAVNAQRREIAARLAKLPLAKLDAKKFGSGKTDAFFNDPAWDMLSASCLGCGSCTFVCPTCQCYDIKDFNTGHGIKRFRCWDSCMYSEFTKMSAGQPRLTQKERFRQRFMHKLVYYPTNNDGLFSCVGCGRCVAKCPIQMNIVKVMKKLGGQKNG